MRATSPVTSLSVRSSRQNSRMPFKKRRELCKRVNRASVRSSALAPPVTGASLSRAFGSCVAGWYERSIGSLPASGTFSSFIAISPLCLSRCVLRWARPQFGVDGRVHRSTPLAGRGALRQPLPATHLPGNASPARCDCAGCTRTTGRCPSQPGDGCRPPHRAARTRRASCPAGRRSSRCPRQGRRTTWPCPRS